MAERAWHKRRDLSTRRENCREYKFSELVVPEDSIVIATIGEGWPARLKPRHDHLKGQLGGNR